MASVLARAIIDHVVHLADVYRWILGAEVVEVYAVANRILQQRHSGVETGGLLSLRFDNGVFGTIDCSWSKPPSYPTWGRLEPGGGRIGQGHHRQCLRAAPDPVWRPGRRRGLGCLGRRHKPGHDRRFVAAIRQGREPAVTRLDGLRALEIVDAAYRSIQAGKPVRLEHGSTQAAD